ncbi:hypothetical protein BGZ97_013125 [Linnemannia gamsii]|uniref:FAD-binding domain-containing protein n=1 Tax=Linnemannia gamsii TaxID=64522 RepID=A0A9P6R1W2_9FUNG|nr:hypothetical protein BGZ97_013125 [Linnemannia gamsii]
MATAVDKPKVLIVGAGLGGLVLGALLEKADVPYVIFERTSTVKPLGSAIAVGSNLLPLFIQLGIYDEFVALSRDVESCTVSREDKGTLVHLDFSPKSELSGYSQYIVARPLLYDLLLRQVPSDKIQFNKRILTIKEEDDMVTIQAADNSVFEGDILVGADGAYSAVRQRLYERLKREGKLPKSDQEELPFSCTCLVGQTEPMDYESTFPEFMVPTPPFYNTLGEKEPFTYVLFATAQSTVTWMVIHHLDAKSSKAAEEQRFRGSENSEWGPHAAQAMCDETRHFPLPIGAKKMTMGDIYDLTPKEKISKVMLEEKVFDTWYSGRTVLLGDACHKLDPAGGHGAVTSMHDALAIANLIYALPSNTTKEIEKSFAEYQAERRPPAVEAFKASEAMATFMNRGFIGSISLFVLKHIPRFLWKAFLKGTIRQRPTCGFLPEIEDRKGTVPADVSPSAEKARAVYKKRQSSAPL